MNLRYLFKGYQLIWQYNRLWFTASLFIHILAGFLPLATLWVTKELINEVLQFIQAGQQNYHRILFLLILQLLITMFQSMLRHMKGILDEYGRVQLDYHVGKKVSNKALSVPFAYFDLPEFYNHHNRISGNYGSKMMTPINNVLGMLQSTISLLSYLGFLLFIHWSLVVLSLLAAIPILLVESKFGNAKFYLMRFQTPIAREANYTNALLQDRQSAKEIRLFGLGSFLLKRWGDLFLGNSRQML